MFWDIFIELFALLGSIIIFGVILVITALVMFIVALFLRAMFRAFKNTGDKKDGKEL